MPVDVEERQIKVGGLLTRHLVAGEGTPLVLLHALGKSALDWRWVLLDLVRSQRVYAPDLLGLVGGANKPADYSPAYFARFVAAYLDALEIDRAAVVGNSLGGLVALRLALSEQARVSALSLIGSAGLGRAASYAVRSPTLPGYGELAVAWGKASRRCPTGLVESEAPFRTSRARPRRVDVPRLSSARGGRSPPKGLSRPHPRLRAPASGRASRSPRCRP